MTTKELRLGNYVEYNGMYLQVSEIYSPKPRQPKRFDGVECVELVCDGFITAVMTDIKPVPITEEILLKCGFSDKEYKDGYIGIDINSGGMTTDFVLTKPTIMGEFQKSYAWEYRAGNIPFFKQIKHLHQLQNLFYSLTQTELDIKL